MRILLTSLSLLIVALLFGQKTKQANDLYVYAYYPNGNVVPIGRQASYIYDDFFQSYTLIYYDVNDIQISLKFVYCGNFSVSTKNKYYCCSEKYWTIPFSRPDGIVNTKDGILFTEFEFNEDRSPKPTNYSISVLHGKR